VKSISGNPWLLDVTSLNIEEEKLSQVAITDSLYTKALFTTISQEDAELSAEKLDFIRARGTRLEKTFSGTRQPLQRCLPSIGSAELGVRKKPSLAPHRWNISHCTNEETSPISMAMSTLIAWIATTMMYDRSIRGLPEPQGLYDPTKSTTHSIHAIA
jgi:hypothetical protein